MTSLLCAAFVTGTLPVTTLVMLPLENYFPAPVTLPEHIDGIIVLGGAEVRDVSAARGQPTLDDKSGRLTSTLALALRYPDAPIVFTGGGASLRRLDYSEAEVARGFFAQFGIGAPRLILEDSARDTYENALRTKELLRPRSSEVWLLVTSALHMPRSVNVFNAAGWTVVPYPVDYKTTGGVRLELTNYPLERFAGLDRAVIEWVGLLAYRMTGRTDSLLPVRP